jgi:hypothetical protein
VGQTATAICPTSHNPIEWAEVWFGYTCPTVIRKNRPQVWGDAISKRKPAIKVDCYRNNIKIERIPSQIFSNCSLFCIDFGRFYKKRLEFDTGDTDKVNSCSMAEEVAFRICKMRGKQFLYSF